MIITLLSLMMLGCQQQSSKLTLRVGHTLDMGHNVHLSLQHMAERLAYYSDGEMALKLYANGQLGSEREMVELLQIGSLAMTKVSAAALEGFVPDMKVYSLPYIFRDRAHRWQVLQGDVGKDILDSLAQARLAGLGYFDAGSRSFYTCDDMVHSPQDVVGKKIRVMNSQTAVKMIDAFGGAATPISWGELYAALQQGVVDGAENNPPAFYSSRHYEICQNYSLNEHTSIPDVIIASKHIIDALTPQQQAWLAQAMNDAVEFQKSGWLAAENHALAEVKKAGVKVVYPDKTEFFAAVAPFHATFNDTIVGRYLERIKQVKTMTVADYQQEGAGE
ncbi:TRAP transporter substrate-binding protein [Thalassotalea euphylliae]|uniref:TRAP transporter substrate-binding protein n=1 Tax=Thalassotalea euphylliae TaxID=1655234 RepID=A0A3E0U1C9_9GAMM|nr:TRAP transporter substrate-binding protein [Thalassotalea euphylliae]REL30738.1 TRAP transporter substrate-binding protein [Thalassotalea euphylliae]